MYTFSCGIMILEGDNMYNEIDVLYGMMVGVLYDQEMHDDEYGVFKRWLDDNQQYQNETIYQYINNVLSKMINKHSINYGSYVELMLTLENASKMANNYRGLSLRVLKGLIMGILSDNILTKDEIENLYDWMHIHNCSAISFYPLLEAMVVNEDNRPCTILSLKDEMKKYLKDA